ncbi:MAG: hypothetical protein Q8T11_04055 [Elusimicrobiota bacterium]|nr:hypothetical protein [Elusimicrobiota bacterium]
MASSLLLAALLAAPASAQKVPDCIHVSTTAVKLRYKPDLESVRDCQEKARQKLIDDAVSKGKPLSYRTIERIDDEQRAQVRDFLANSGTVIEGATKSDRALGGVTEEDRSRVSSEEGAALGALEERLHAAAGDGKDGITPAMGRDLIDSLTKQQGFVSGEMKDLIDAVVRDGGKLTPETMKRLQKAGRAAKGAGLDLNIDKGTEKNLLEHDFDSDKEAKPEAHADPGNL